MKSPGGVNYGWNILLKVFAARRDLADGPVATAKDIETPDISKALDEWKVAVDALQKKNTRRSRSKRSV